MRQHADVDDDVHGSDPTVLMISATSAAATSSLLMTGQDATWIASPPSVKTRVRRCTVLRSPPITPVDGETSFATIQSQPLRWNLALALSIRCSVSAAKPITSGGRPS